MSFSLRTLDPKANDQWMITGLVVSAIATYCLVSYALLREVPHLLLPIAAGCAGLFAAVVLGTRVGLPVYLATTYGTVLAFPFLPFTLNRIFAAFLFLTIVVEFLRFRDRTPHLSALWLWVVFNVYLLTAAFFLRPEGAEFPIETVFYLIISLLIAFRYWSKDWLRWMMWGFVATSVLMIVIPGLIELVFGVDISPSGGRRSLGRIDGLSVNAIMFAYTALFTIPMALVLLLTERSLVLRSALLLILVFLIFLSMATLNRQTPIMLAVMLTVFVSLMRSSYRPLVAGFMIAAALIAAPFVGYQLIERFGQARRVQTDPSLAVRSDNLRIASKIWQDHWLFGIGHSHYRLRWKDYKIPGEMVIVQYMWAEDHFIDFGYVQILTEYGVVGATMVLLMLVLLLRALAMMYRRSLSLEDPFWTNMVACLAALFAQLLLSNMVQDTIGLPRTYFLIGMIAAVYTGIVMIERKDPRR